MSSSNYCFLTCIQISQEVGQVAWYSHILKNFPQFVVIHIVKDFDCVDHNKLWKILKEKGIPGHVTCLLRNLYAGQEQQLELDMEQQTGSK